jgi:Protein of unknown function (DUF3108)
MRYFKIVFCTLILACLLVTPAEAKKANHHKEAANEDAPSLIPALPPVLTNYDIYVGGIHLVAAQIWFEEQGSTYHTVVKASTYGFIGKLVPWHTFLEAHGRIVGDRFKPEAFYTRDEWAKKPKITKLTFTAKGDVVPEFDPPNTDKNREIVTPEQRLNSLDPISALLQMLGHVAVENSCSIPVPVFDGKRRFDITGRDEGYGMAGDEDYETYSGKARLCGGDFKMISGEWKDGEHAHFWQKTETESGRDPFHIWLAAPAKNMPEIPVRLETSSVAGLVIIHLTSWRYASSAEIKAQTP